MQEDELGLGKLEFLWISLLEGIYLHGQGGNLKMTLRCMLGGWILMMGDRGNFSPCRRVSFVAKSFDISVSAASEFLSASTIYYGI